MERKKLTALQEAFAYAYVGEGEGNKYKSALLAGYSETYAKSQSHALLENVGVVKKIEELNHSIQRDSIASMIEVKQFWTSSMRDTMNEPKDRLKASEFIAKMNGAFIDRVELTGTMDVNPLKGLSTEDLQKMADDLE